MDWVFKPNEIELPPTPSEFVMIDEIQQLHIEALNRKVAEITRRTTLAKSLQQLTTDIDDMLASQSRKEDMYIAEIMKTTETMAELKVGDAYMLVICRKRPGTMAYCCKEKSATEACLVDWNFTIALSVLSGAAAV